MNWLQERVQDLDPWVLVALIVGFFISEYVLLAALNVHTDLMGLGWLLNPLGITLLTVGALVLGTGMAYLQER